MCAILIIFRILYFYLRKKEFILERTFIMWYGRKVKRPLKCAQESPTSGLPSCKRPFKLNHTKYIVLQNLTNNLFNLFQIVILFNICILHYLQEQLLQNIHG